MIGAACAVGGAPLIDILYATWNDNEPDYRIYPGDQPDCDGVASAPGAGTAASRRSSSDGRITLLLRRPDHGGRFRLAFPDRAGDLGDLREPADPVPTSAWR